MAESDKIPNGQTAVDGRTTLQFDLLDEETRKKIIECINERGQISVVLGKGEALASGNNLAAFAQIID